MRAQSPVLKALDPAVEERQQNIYIEYILYIIITPVLKPLHSAVEEQQQNIYIQLIYHNYI